MVSCRLREVVRSLPDHRQGALDLLSTACADIVGITGAGIMLMTDDVQRGSVRTTDEVSAIVEDLQFELGEGPCVEAYLVQRPVLEPDLAAPALRRWPAFTPRAVAAGVGAIFGYPLAVGDVRLGSLNLYRVTPGSLDAEEHADACRLAELIAIEMLGAQADAGMGEVASELRDGADLQDRVHQATGMVAAQLDVGVDHALRVLRAHALAGHRSLRDVAADVIDRTLRFNEVTDG
jgi:hypothetical protein